MVRHSGLLLIFILAAACGPAPDDTPGSVAPLPFLSVSNQQILNSRGETVILKGVTFTSGVWFYNPSNPGASDIENIQFMQSEADFKRVKEWGANTINLYMNYYWFDGSNFTRGLEYLETLVGWCSNQGLYLIPTFTVYPEGGLRGGAGFFGSPAAMTNLLQCWVGIAEYFQDCATIAGYDIMNEPHSEGDGQTREQRLLMLSNYQIRLIDAIRAVDSRHTIYIEPYYGDEDNLVALPCTNLVYNIHYYKPFYFTSQGMPWMAEGGVPTNVSYPGWVLTNSTFLSDSYYPNISNTAHWSLYEGGAVAPAQADFVVAQVFSDSDSGAEIWFDMLEISTNNGIDYFLFPNGSFEVKNEISPNPLYWKSWQGGGGRAVLTNGDARQGSNSLYLQGMTGWGEFMSWDWWLNTAGGVPVTPGQQVLYRYYAKASGATLYKNGFMLKWVRANRMYCDAAWLQESVSKTADFSALHQVPILVGEFSPSLAGQRPDILHYLQDVISLFDAQGWSWTYYPYRETWTGTRYMGIYNGAYGTSTAGCVEDTEIVQLLREALSGP